MWEEYGRDMEVCGFFRKEGLVLWVLLELKLDG